MKKAFTRSQADAVFTFALLVNSVLGFVSVIAFFVSAWWIFLILGTIGLPFTITGILIYKYTRFREPMQRFAKNFVLKMYDKIVLKRGNFIRRIYHTACWFIPNDAWQHIHWGYATMTPEGRLLEKIEPQDEEKRYYNQLYYYLATGMGNWNTLEGKNILELKCGGGGGLSFISRYLLPQKAIGVDDSSSQIDFCKKNFGENPNMHFYAIDAFENVSKIGELCDVRIDMAISLQSSKHMKNFKHFIHDIESILKPGGVFAFSDIRLTEDWPELEKELEGDSMKIIKKEDITKNVIQALNLDELDKWSVMTRTLGSIVRHFMKRIGIVKNNAISESLTAGHTKAMAYVLHKMSESNILVQ